MGLVAIVIGLRQRDRNFLQTSRFATSRAESPKADNHRLDSVRLTTESTRRHCGEKQEHQQYVVLRASGRGDSAYI